MVDARANFSKTINAKQLIVSVSINGTGGEYRSGESGKPA